MSTVDDAVLELDRMMQLYEDNVATSLGQARVIAQQLENYIVADDFPQDFINAIFTKGRPGHAYLKKLFEFFKTVHDKDPDEAPAILGLLQIFFVKPTDAINLLRYNLLTAAKLEEFLAHITDVCADGRKEALMQILINMLDSTPEKKARKIEWLKIAVYGDNDLHRFFACQRGWSEADKNAGTLGVLKKELERLQSAITITYAGVEHGYQLEQKEAACEFICNISDLDDRIKFLKEALKKGTLFNDFFSLQRRLTPTTEFSGSLYNLKVALRATEKEKFSKDSKQALQDFKQKYNDNADAAVRIIEEIKDRNVMPRLIINKDEQLTVYIEFLQQLINDSSDNAVSDAVLALLQKTFETKTGERIFPSIDLAHAIVSFLPEDFVWYRNCLMTLINKRKGDADFFVKIMGLLTRTDISSSKIFIARTLDVYNALLLKVSSQRTYSGDHLVIVSADQVAPHITSVDDILKSYVALIAELFAKMPAGYRDNDVIKQSFMQLWPVECMTIFNYVEIFDESLFTLLENNFFTYIKRPGDIEDIVSADGLYKSTLVGHLFSAVDQLDSIDAKIALLTQAFDRKNYDLAKAVWLQQGIVPCNLRSGSLEDIVAKAAEIQNRAVRELTIKLEAIYGDYRISTQILDYFGSLFHKGEEEAGPGPREELEESVTGDNTL